MVYLFFVGLELCAILTIGMELYVFDIDGTLIDDSKDANGDFIFPDEVKDAVNALLRKGNAVAFASGRPLSGVNYFLSKVDPSPLKFAITANGASLYKASGELLHAEYLPFSVFYEMSSRFADYPNFSYMCYFQDGTLGYSEPSPFAPMESRWNNMPMLDVTAKSVNLNSPCEKCLMNTGSIDAYGIEIPSDLQDKYAVVATSHSFLEFMAKGIDKANATERLMNYLGLESEQVRVFGDGGNDVEMIRRFHGVATGNAIEECKKNAAFVTKTATEFGVVYALKHFYKAI
jgi:Cof subfamily protein (haloacid dehalogenase superfamily)